MAAPFFFGAGAAVSGINSVSAAWPANHAVDDVALLVIETDGAGTTLTPAGWTHVTGSPVTDVASAAGSKLHVLWRRATSTAEANVATGDSGDHQTARIFVFRGVKTTGDPWNAITTGTKATASTTATLPSITTTVDESLIVGIVSRPDDSASTTAFGAPVNAGITWDTNADIESGSTSGNGGGFVMVAGVEATASATGTTTLTCPNVTNAYVTIGLSRTSAQSMTGEVGAFNEAGQDAGLVAIRRTTGDLGAFTLAGQDATLTFVDLTNFALPVDPGAFATTGQAADLRRSFSLTADTAAISEQGQPAGLIRTARLPADVTALSLAGQDATLVKARPIAADAGQFTLTGQPVQLPRTYVLQAAAAAITEQGQDAGLARSRIMPASPGALTLTGQAASTLWNRPIAAGLGTFTLAGQAANLPRTYVLSADAGGLSETGQDAALNRTRRLLLETAELVLSGADVGFRRQTIIPSWAASTAVAASALVRPTVVTGNGLVFRALNAGTTGTTQPVWPTTFGGTVVDGTVTWRAVSQVTGDFQSLEPSSIIELFELQLNVLQHGSSETYRFHAGANANNNGEVVWAGNTYQRFPIEADGFEYTGQGQLPRPKVRVSNVLGTITAILTTLPSGLERAKVTRIRTLARYIDNVNFPAGNPFGLPDPTAEFPREVFYIDRKTAETRDVIEFELAAAFDLQGVRAPKRQCIANICQWKYRSVECGYSDSVYYTADDVPTADSALDVCGKRLGSCEARHLPFTLTGSTVVGSTTLTVSSTTQINAGAAGYPVSGFGIPAGTIISSITSATTVAMSAAATATTTVTVNGTPSSTASTMTVASATGLAIGHAVSGTYIPPGTTVSAISGTTITLTQRPYSITRVGIFRDDPVSAAYVYLFSLTGITNGMRVFGSNGISGTVTDVESLTGEIRLSNYGNLNTLSNGLFVTLYFMPATVTQASYTFTASNLFTFRSITRGLPYGGFPGIGTYFT